QRTPNVGADTDYTFTVYVSDHEFEVNASVSLQVRFVNNPPVADAGSEIVIAENADLEANAFRLDGSGSRDQDEADGFQQLSYTWQVPEGSGLQLDDVNAVSPRIIALPDVTATEAISVTLEVSDGIASDIATTAVRVGFVNQSPEVVAID